jgi:hypothetical protein
MGDVDREGPEQLAELTELDVSIVMPCLDEAATLAACIADAQGWLDRSGVRGEIVIADNGSTDGSPAIAEAAGARVVHVPVRGYGAALRAGIEAARARWVVMGDADQSYDFTALDPFLAELRDGADLVMGNRFRGGIEPGAMPWLHRRLGNPVLSGLGRLFFRVPVGDFHCGLRAFDREAIRGLDLRTTGMEFASEMVVKSSLHHLDIREVPTVLRPDGRDRPPHLRTWSDGWRHLRFLLLYSPTWLFLIPGAVLLTVGLVVAIVLAIGPVSVGSVTFDVGTLVYAAGATFIGAQAIGFALLTRTFAESHGLLPPSPGLARFFRVATLERGLLVALVVVLAGTAAALASLLRWGGEGFGDLDPTQQLRVVVPAVLGLVHGVSLGFTSFALSILRLRTGPT